MGSSTVQNLGSNIEWSSGADYSSFGLEFLEFLRLLHVEPEEFHPKTLAGEPLEQLKLNWLHISRSQVFNLLKSKPARLRQGMAERLARRADVFLQREVARCRDDGTLGSFEKVITKFGFVRFRQGHWTVDAKALVDLYGQSKRGEQTGSASPPQSQRKIRLELIVDAPEETLSPERLAEQIKKLIDARQYSLVNVTEGCTTVIIEVSPEGAEAIQAAFAARRVQFPELIGIREIDTMRTPAISKLLYRKSQLIDPKLANASEQFKKSWRRVMAQEQFVRPWRRLRHLLSFDVQSSPLAHVISESDDRAYASPGILGRLSSLAVDFGATLVFWPLIVCVFLSTLFAIVPGTYGVSAVALGICSGIALALCGSQPCSILVSPLACGGGTVVMGIAFGLVQTLILAHTQTSSPLAQASVRSDFFLSVVGGLTGLSAPAWRVTFPSLSIFLLVSTMAVSIAAAGWLMGQPQRAKERTGGPGVWKVISGGVAGAAAGSGIGLVYACNRILKYKAIEPIAFVFAFALIGGFWMLAGTFLRTREVRRSIVTAICHVLVATILFEIAFWAAGTPLGCMGLAAASGYFHSTWFTMAFVLGKWRGGVRGAFAGTTLEGAVGFTAFIVARIFQT